MAIDIVGIALDFIASYGLIAIFILLVLDGALLLPVFPGEIVLVMAVATYATDVNSLIMLILLTTAAGLLGSLILYGITRGGGRRLVERFPRFFMMPRKRRERLERVFQNPAGQSLVLFMRVFPLTRVLVSIPAGLARMPIFRYVILSTIGLTIYHAGFLWFAYEAGREDSPIADQKARLQEAYASPAMEFVETNIIITGLVLLGIGIIASIKASRNMMKDPEESAGSLLGLAATIVLFWGGIVLGAATYMDPDSVYTLIELGGLDIHVIAAAVGYSAVQVLAAVSIAGVILGYGLGRLRRAAHERRKTQKAIQKAIQKRKGHDAPRHGRSLEPTPAEARPAPPPPSRPTYFEAEPVSDKPEYEWSPDPDDARQAGWREPDQESWKAAVERDRELQRRRERGDHDA